MNITATDTRNPADAIGPSAANAGNGSPARESAVAPIGAGPPFAYLLSIGNSAHRDCVAVRDRGGPEARTWLEILCFVIGVLMATLGWMATSGCHSRQRRLHSTAGSRRSHVPGALERS